MKSILTKIWTMALLLATTATYAQQSWQWGQRVGLIVKDMATDRAGNVYALWSLHGSYTIDGHTINGYDVNNGDIALTSFSCDGSYRWTKVIGGESVDAGMAIGTDTLDGVYLTGGVSSDNYQNSIYVSGDTTIAPTARRMILLKYDTAGNFQWLRMPEQDTLTGYNLSGHSSFLFNMDVSPDGRCYCYCLLAPGSYANGAFTATYPNDFLNNRGSCVYALKYDRNGNCTGGVHLDMSYAGTSYISTRFKRDPLSGNYYLNGYISYGSSDTLKFGNTVLTNSNGDLPAYVTCYDSLGEAKWVKVVNDSSSYFPTNLLGKPAIDNAGNVYVTGCSYNSNSFGNYTFHNDIGVYGFPILAKLSPAGDVLWATNASSTADNTGEAVSFANGTVAVTGEYGAKMIWGNFGAHNTTAQNEGFNAFLARFNATTGAAIGFDTLASSILSNEYTSILTSDKQGNFYVGGTFPGTLYVGNSTIYNQSSQHDGFLAKFGSANCNCTLPTAHYIHNSLQSGGTISFTYDGSTPVDSVVWDFGDGERGSGTNVTHNYPQDGSYTVCATAYNDCGSNMYCETLQVGDVGIGKIPGFANISIYPNPTTEEIIINNAENGTVLDIYSVTGQQMLHQVLKGTKDKVHVSSMSSGVYLMRFKDKEGRQGNSKFVKQ